MRYTYNAVKFTDKASFNKNKTKKNVKIYYDEASVIVFKDRKTVTPNKTKVSHTYQMGDIKYGVPVDKAIMRTFLMEDAIAYCEKEKIHVYEKYEATGVMIVGLPRHTTFNDFHSKVIDSGIFYSIQQDTIIEIVPFGIDYTYSEQWQLPALRCQEAWDLIDAAPPAVDNIVCVMDWGCDTTHPDLAGKLVNNLNIAVTSQAANNVYPYDTRPRSADGIGGDLHGTPCAGQIVAINNGLNTTGVSPYYTKVSFVYIYSRFFPQSGSAFVQGINHAISQPTCVAISCSFGGGSYQQASQDAITDALLYGRGGNAATNTLGLGTLVVAAAGNGPCNGGCAAPPNRNFLPASYDGALSITAVAFNGGNYIRTSWADWGTKLFAAAPGQQTPGTDILGGDGLTFGGYTTYDTTLFGGTSSATPITSGVVALVAASNPGLSANGIKEAIQLTCSKIGPYDYNALPGEPGKALETGWGMVDAYAAVLYATSGQIDPGPGVTPNLRVSISGPGIVNAGEDYTLSYSLLTNITLPAAETMTVTIFYSTDIVYDITDTVLTSFSATIPANDFKYQGQYTFTIPNTLSGNYYLGVNATSIGGETYTLDNTAFQNILVIAPPQPPTGLNLGVEITQIPYDSTAALPLIRYQFQNLGADPVFNFRYRKGFVGRDTFEYEIVKTILSEEYLIFETLWDDVPPQQDWATTPYRIEILSVNGGIPDDAGGDNISEEYIDPGLPIPNYLL